MKTQDEWVINPEWKKLTAENNIDFLPGEDAYQEFNIGPEPQNLQCKSSYPTQTSNKAPASSIPSAS